jgi:hypothetical protein
MKTEEDEAFEEIERRQGGGFPAKRQMAMHKTQDQNICRHYKQWQHCHICDLESQVAELASIKAILDEYGLQAIDFVADFKAALAQPVQDGKCELCGEYQPFTGVCGGGKENPIALCFIPPAAQPAQEPVATVTSETGNPDVTMSWWHEPALPVGTKLYTTPPKRPWVGLTDEELLHIDVATGLERAAVEMISNKLKEKNNG